MENKRYTEEQYRQRLNSSIFGIVLTVGVNLGILLTCGFSGIKYIYPPPEEKTLVIDFTEQEMPKIKIKRYGREPSTPIPTPGRKPELVQKSEGQYKGQEQNVAKEATMGTDGDVEMPEAEREEEIDNLSLFPSAKNTDKDTLKAQTSIDPSDALRAGHAAGNTPEGKTEGSPTARVQGRTTVGVPARPQYGVQNEGTVVVEIWVDRLGGVTKAVAGVEGTTVTDKNLWNAARKAALDTRFNPNPEAPGMQQGSITYIFKLK